ncbi:MAG: hypothetical protein M1820_006221 [Bogoriella megaspora]|nr:MAG: hypothetical protein M1820_006221 [Bogoriella megaspora]
MDKQNDQTSSPFLPMFETFRAELDEHHDRRERIVKASRDITAASKKIIFTLQRVRQVNHSLHASVTKQNQQHWTNITNAYTGVTSDLQSPNTYRYARNITGGNQEYMEALSFQHYLETQSLITFSEAQQRLSELTDQSTPITLSLEDYLLGIFDMTGELMRFAITSIATSQTLPGSTLPPTNSKPQLQPQPTHTSLSSEDTSIQMDIDTTSTPPRRRDVLTDLRTLRAAFEALNIEHGTYLYSDVQKKMDVMQQSVEKVEKALYGMVVRGSERPKGWMPDMEARRGEVETF